MELSDTTVTADQCFVVHHDSNRQNEGVDVTCSECMHLSAGNWPPLGVGPAHSNGAAKVARADTKN